MAEVVADTGCIAVAVDWRRAPEDPYPAALDDCYDALRWLAATRHGASAEPLVVGGASSGGVASRPASPARRATGARCGSTPSCSSTRCSTTARRPLDAVA